jgi:hypothetical protein
MSVWVSGGVRRGLALAVQAISPLLVVAACESSPKTGVIEGTAMPCIGPGIPPTVAPVLTISVNDHAGRQVAQQTVRSPYRFRFTIKPGDYVVNASVREDVPKAVHVQPRRTASVALTNSCI